MLDIQDIVQDPGSVPIGDGDLVLQIRMGITALAGEDLDGWTGSAKSARVQELLETRERLDAEILRTVGSWDRDRAWEIDGSLSPRAWLTHRTPVGESSAQRLVKDARLIKEHDTIATALADGAITTPHVEAIARVMSRGRQHLLDQHQDVLVEQAMQLPVREFTTVMRRWAELADDELAKDAFGQKWERRHLHASTGLDGWVNGDFYLDPVAGQSLINALDHVAPPDPHDAPDGPRPLSQRRADGLADITGWYLNGGRPGGNPPTVNLTADVSTALGEPPDMTATRCDIDGVGPVTRSVLDQMCCKARFTRFITAGPSLILDMGRSERIATKGQRQAISVRDRHCRFPSCDRRPQWCDIHHIEGWVESLGKTDLDNLVMLCRRHHTLVHNSGWTITQAADGEFEFTHPARGP